MNDSLMEGFLAEFDDSRYPREFLKRYEPMECLAAGQRGETLLVRDRQSGESFVAKCYADPSLLSREHEGRLLQRLRHDGLPAFAGEYREGSLLCVVREYARGITLGEWAARQKPAREQVIAVGVQLCDILDYLHSRKPPVIHRDLKPGNIIIDKSGRIKLIDLGISRAYDEQAGGDTVCFGTAQYAPPEQYGFSQTDSRADIFSLGVVLRSLLTGETGEKATDKIADRRLRRIVAKCTAFSPGDRYADARSLRRALTGAGSRVRKRALGLLAAALASAVLLAAGFTLGRYTDFMEDVLSPAGTVAFSEPLVEQAVRQALGKDDGQALAPGELARVTHLYIWGGRIASDLDEYYALGGAGEPAGPIASLDDIALLPNLQALMIGNQKINDLSPLSELTRLTDLDLCDNPVTDISALSALTGLRLIGLNGTQVADLTPLAGCPGLNKLVLNDVPCQDFSFLESVGDIEFLQAAGIQPEKVLPRLQGKAVRQLKLGYVLLPSLADLAGIQNLQELFLEQVVLRDVEDIGELTYLTVLRLTGMNIDDLSPLLSLPYLQRLEIDESLEPAAQAIADRARFDIVYS